MMHRILSSQKQEKRQLQNSISDTKEIWKDISHEDEKKTASYHHRRADVRHASIWRSTSFNAALVGTTLDFEESRQAPRSVPTVGYKPIVHAIFCAPPDNLDCVATLRQDFPDMFLLNATLVGHKALEHIASNLPM